MIPKRTYWKQLRSFCRECMGDAKTHVVCQGMKKHGRCPLYDYRIKQNRKDQNGKLLGLFYKKTVLKRIKEHCREICLNHQPLHVCNSPDCQLYQFLFDGKDHRIWKHGESEESNAVQ